MTVSARPRTSTTTALLGLAAILLGIVGGACGILKGIVLISIGVGVALVGVALACVVGTLAVRRGANGGMFLAATAAIVTFFATTTGVLTLLARIITKGL